MEGYFHVEVPHAAKSGDKAGKATAPLGPGGKVVVLNESHHNLRAATEEGFVQRVPTRGILERDVSAGRCEGSGRISVVEAYGEVEGSLPVAVIPAVQDG